jgi:hypothetical protein
VLVCASGAAPQLAREALARTCHEQQPRLCEPRKLTCAARERRSCDARDSLSIGTVAHEAAELRVDAFARRSVAQPARSPLAHVLDALAARASLDVARELVEG